MTSICDGKLYSWQIEWLFYVFVLILHFRLNVFAILLEFSYFFYFFCIFSTLAEKNYALYELFLTQCYQKRLVFNPLSSLLVLSFENIFEIIVFQCILRSWKVYSQKRYWCAQINNILIIFRMNLTLTVLGPHIVYNIYYVNIT